MQGLRADLQRFDRNAARPSAQEDRMDHYGGGSPYWKTNGIKHNFLLLAYEYLFIFRKIGAH
jgi:hypothetical protein